MQTHSNGLGPWASEEESKPLNLLQVYSKHPKSRLCFPWHFIFLSDRLRMLFLVSSILDFEVEEVRN